MKNFLISLLKGIGIALAISLSVCFFALYWGNWRAVIWYAVGVIIVWRILLYLCGKVWIHHYKDLPEGVDRGHYATLTEKVENMIAESAAFLAVAVVFWLIGKFGEWVFNIQASIFELTILNGVVLFVICFLALLLLAAVFYCIRHFNWDTFKSVLPYLAECLLILAISIGVGLATIYFFLPSWF